MLRKALMLALAVANVLAFRGGQRTHFAHRLQLTTAHHGAYRSTALNRMKPLSMAQAAAKSSAEPVHDQSRIRNFCIVAHVDHGKSTFADRLLETTGTVSKRQMKDQLLDNLALERERGITIKLQAARMHYTHPDEPDKPYVLNLIDTPGHVDFSYEVSRSLAACEGALVLVDATQGIQSQTIANVNLALQNNLTLIPVLNKIDLPSADIDRVLGEIEDLIGVDRSEVIRASGRTGAGVEEVLQRVVRDVPPPSGSSASDAPLRALVYQTQYDVYKGVIVFLRVVDGQVKVGDKIRLMATEKEFEVVEVGVMKPHFESRSVLAAGEVGYLCAAIRSVADARVGDTITQAGPASAGVVPLTGYQEAKSMVFCGVYPSDSSDYNKLRDALGKLKLEDAALKFEPENSAAMGFGFRCGFLGLLHMDVVQERLEKEYDVDLVVTAPSVVYRAILKSGETVLVDTPSKLPPPEQLAEVQEPFAHVEILTPVQYMGPMMELAQGRRGKLLETKYLNQDRVVIKSELPLTEILSGFYDRLKSDSKGYASMDYTVCGYQKTDVAKVDIRINGELAPPLTFLSYRPDAHSVGKAMCEKLKELIPRQQFVVPIQACIGTKPIASAQISALRKDVTAKCYGGDQTRKNKLLERQAEGKKRMKMLGRVNVPQEAFMAVLKLND